MYQSYEESGFRVRVRWNDEIRNGVNGLRVWCNGVSDNVTMYVFQTPKRLVK